MNSEIVKSVAIVVLVVIFATMFTVIECKTSVDLMGVFVGVAWVIFMGVGFIWGIIWFINKTTTPKKPPPDTPEQPQKPNNPTE